MIEREKINEDPSKGWLKESIKKIIDKTSKECKKYKWRVELHYKILKDFENLQKYIYDESSKSYDAFNVSKKWVIVYKNKAKIECTMRVTKTYVWHRGSTWITTISIKDWDKDLNLALDTMDIDGASFWLTDDSGNKIWDKLDDKKVEEYLWYIHKKVDEYKETLKTPRNK